MTEQSEDLLLTLERRCRNLTYIVVGLGVIVAVLLVVVAAKGRHPTAPGQELEDRVIALEDQATKSKMEPRLTALETQAKAARAPSAITATVVTANEFVLTDSKGKAHGRLHVLPNSGPELRLFNDNEFGPGSWLELGLNDKDKGAYLYLYGVEGRKAVLSVYNDEHGTSELSLMGASGREAKLEVTKSDGDLSFTTWDRAENPTKGVSMAQITTDGERSRLYLNAGSSGGHVTIAPVIMENSKGEPTYPFFDIMLSDKDGKPIWHAP